MNKKIIYTFSTVLSVFLLLTRVSLAVWNAPTSAPPNGNAPEPVNLTMTIQQKLGGLIVASGAGITTGFIVTNGNVGIGTVAPSQKLDVAGVVKATGLQISTGAASGRVLTSDGAGNASWQSPSGGGGSGTVTSVGSGNGLMGGPITTSGTISINAPVCGGGQASSWNGSSWTCVSVGGGGGGGVSGSGSANQLAKWTGSSSLGTARIWDDGNYISLSTGSSVVQLSSGSAYMEGGSGQASISLNSSGVSVQKLRGLTSAEWFNDTGTFSNLRAGSGGSNQPSSNDVDGWLRLNINGTNYYVPLFR
ncbi:MAG: hypothetical protein A3B23_01180 [Candidatus Colwellbacteria bacterium RIFCSPLOWO2_01_FULL_48_10]|uniref:Uncharacterized protein n=1 Tax=Candidatus Colwellbacteria bacterium RIFCSPLOWO2_01_FULL_48_10 TaxID=1797690 RepID=A0A1G1Z4J6_9BACT|nr:MAG: hypothetical protein A3B23_01180 [Candidatus Colwellbacteria bacterium RIFCSPLOWO2_01_FULL_48_10]